MGDSIPPEAARILEIADVASLGGDYLAELAEGGAVGDGLLSQGAAFVNRGRALTEDEHLGGQGAAFAGEVFGAVAAQGLDDLDDLKRVADGVPERAVHVGDERHRFAPGFLAD